MGTHNFSVEFATKEPPLELQQLLHGNLLQKRFIWTSNSTAVECKIHMDWWIPGLDSHSAVQSFVK